MSKVEDVDLDRRRLLTATATVVGGVGMALVTGATLAQNPPAAPASAPAPTKDELAAELANRLLACSYDGSPMRFSPPDLSKGTSADGQVVVAEIMKYTGLPQNFDVVEGEVPNAAAMIVVGSDKLLRRVIAFNRQFMGDVKNATKNSDWAPVSIMAHEIGHHLSGHTLMPGGSRPPIELEADKFSGFVLYKMGASMADAQKAIEMLAPMQDGPTHPGRPKRIVAIQQGWKQACDLQATQCDGSVTAGGKPAAPTVAQAPAAAPAQPGRPAPSAPATDTGAASRAQAPATAPTSPPPVAPVPAAGTVIAAPGTVDMIPVPGKDAVPYKFDRFVMDETGLFDPEEKTKLARAMFDYAKTKDVEVVTLIVKDLRGMSADDYAYAMMRLLRVGKMDVGNGAVLVAAPRQQQVGVALGSGLFLEIGDRQDEIKSKLMSFVENRKVDDPGTATWSEFVSDAAHFIRDYSKTWEWILRFPDFKDFLKAVADDRAAREKDIAGYDPETSLTWRKITRVQGNITSLNGPKEYSQEGEGFKQMLAERAPKGGYTTEIKTPDGKILIAYIDAHAQQMMTAKLAEGQPFSFILRAEMPEDMVFNILSYDAL